VSDGTGSHKDNLLVAILSFRGSSKTKHISRSDSVQYHLKARCGDVVAFINDYMSIILNNGRNSIVFLVYQGLIRGYINDAGGFFLSTADDANLGFWQKRS